MRRPRPKPTRRRWPPAEQAEARRGARALHPGDREAGDPHAGRRRSQARSHRRSASKQAKTEDWAIPGALPDWIKRVRFTGDIRVRGQSDTFAEDNATDAYIDFLTVNDTRRHRPRRSGRARSTPPRIAQRLRARLRFGVEAELGYGWSTALSPRHRQPARSGVHQPDAGQHRRPLHRRRRPGLYAPHRRVATAIVSQLTLTGGRMPNPVAVHRPDLRQGPDVRGHHGQLPHRAAARRAVQPVRVPDARRLSDRGVRGQLRRQVAARRPARHGIPARQRLAPAARPVRTTTIENLLGQRNVLDSNLLDYTAPKFLQRGNTLFDIRNDADAHHQPVRAGRGIRLVDFTAGFDWRLVARLSHRASAATT